MINKIIRILILTVLCIYIFGGVFMAAANQHGLNADISIEDNEQDSNGIKINVTAEIPPETNIQGIQIDFNYSDNFPTINKEKTRIISNTTGWSMVGITEKNLLSVGNISKVGGKIEAELVFEMPKNITSYIQYKFSVGDAIASTSDGRELEFNVLNKELIIERNSSEVTENTTANSNSGIIMAETTEITTMTIDESETEITTIIKQNSTSRVSSGGSRLISETTSSISNDKKTDIINQTNSIVMKIDSADINIFGKVLKNDVPPIIMNSRTMLPIRIIAESLGAKVDWDGNNKQVIITKENTKIVIAIGSKEAFVNYKAFSIDSPPIIRNGRTYVPVRFVTENLGAKVDWNGDGKTITITK